jgi:adenine-specific DNA-methyltransferase
MKLILNTPLQTLNKAFRKEKVTRDSFTRFKNELKVLINCINEDESEEHLKYPLRDFLKNTFYSDHEINTKGKTDLGIYLDKTDKSKLGVIIETKKPSNAVDMISAADINKKAMHEAILYYLRERIDEKNNEVKTIIITNIYEWFIFNAHDFERLFFKSNLTKEYGKWKAGQKTSLNTPLFYNEIAKTFLDECDKEISGTWFDLRDFQKGLDADDKKEEKKLTALYKIFSGVTLLKEPFTNDSNSLDKRFYNELLYIIGLEEKKEGSKKTIKRKADPDHGSLIENTMATLEANEKIYRIENRERYGDTKSDQLFNVALELVITWVNRILFLKLLEAQLVRYHQGNKENRFLDTRFIADFDELNELFFEVLAKQEGERKDYIKEKFRFIPYLNSSLFEMKSGSLEDNTILISNLKGRFNLPVFSQTVLRSNGKKLTGELPTLKYLFDFLDAYDFTNEGAGDIQEENKTLINASVLGLIFEKINGYKDGSFFTPGFITMYMCRETIRRAVLQKFEENKGWKCESIDQLKDKIENRPEANAIVNSLKICDPAVGSGHFLVSALNEIIAVKSELDILCYRDGNRIRNYTVEIVNDELIITDKESEDIFEYRLNEKDRPVDYLQDMQEALFHEKQTIIENCLFGVDINPNSVNICRLRLWIELLKNSYYTQESGYTTLETLPNIDINIKCGNSLVSRFQLDADLSKALKTIKYNINTYRKCVVDYKNATNKGDKRSLEILINQIKSDFRDEIQNNDPKYIRLNKIKGEMSSLINQTRMFELSPEQRKGFDKKVEKLASDQTKLEKDISEIKNNIIYRNAFEWRFEFPEVLDDEGNFMGFDVVIGNPPYFSLSKIREHARYFENSGYQTYSKGSDIYCVFYERGNQILKTLGLLTYITSNSWLRAIYGELLKKYFVQKMQPICLLNIEDIQIFEEATVESNIIILKKSSENLPFQVCQLSDDYLLGSSLSDYFQKKSFNFIIPPTLEWSIGNEKTISLRQKVEKDSNPLKSFNVQINFGIKTGYNDAFIIDEETKNRLIFEDPKCSDIIKPIIRGRDLQKYYFVFSKQWIICTFPSLKINIENYPSILNHLNRIGKKRLEQSGAIGSRKKTNNQWYETQDSIAYWNDFEKSKIIWGEISDKPKFAYDETGYYAEATTFVMTGNNLKYLLAILNSRLSEWYFNQISTTTGMGTNRWKKYKIELLPIKIPTNSIVSNLEALVDRIIANKKESDDSSYSLLECQIDQLVYQLYGLTDEEIEMVENA